VNLWKVNRLVFDIFHTQINDRDPANRRGLYKNPLIQKVLNVMWFRNRQDEGVVYDNYFQPIKVETLALVLTVVSVLSVYKIYYCADVP
jgi:hypothetical protein